MAYKPVFAFSYGDVQYTFDDAVLKAVGKCDIYVDKEELLKALQYDRGQYQQGHTDGYRQALDDVKRLMETYDVTFKPLEKLYKEK
jgi:hypothetical protein